MATMSCDWPVDDGCLPALPELPDDPTPEQQAAYDLAKLRLDGAKSLAVSVLWALSGRQFGVCPQTIRPCPPSSACDAQGRWYQLAPYVLAWNGDDWLNIGCGCTGTCVKSGPNVVHLPGPAQSVDEVKIGDTVLDPGEYRLEGDRLIRLTGRWPSQNFTRPMGFPGTWSVTYQRGIPVPPGVGLLTGTLAREFVLACDGDKKCRLPSNVTSLTRRGVSYKMYDAAALLAARRTGVTEIDMWLNAVNPNAIQQAPAVV